MEVDSTGRILRVISPPDGEIQMSFGDAGKVPD